MAMGIALAAGLCATTAPARATDYFALDLRSAEFSPQPLGPSAQFQSGTMIVPLPVATVRETAAPSPLPAVAAQAHRVRTAPVRIARRAHRNPLNAFASDPRPRVRACTANGVCVWDSRLNRWRAP